MPRATESQKAERLNRARYCPLWRPYLRLLPLPFFRHPRLQPFLDQANEAPVRNSMLDKLLQPFVRHVVEGHHDTLPIISTFPNASPSRVRTTPSTDNLWRSCAKSACPPACSSCSFCPTAAS